MALSLTCVRKEVKLKGGQDEQKRLVDWISNEILINHGEGMVQKETGKRKHPSQNRELTSVILRVGYLCCF